MMLCLLVIDSVALLFILDAAHLLVNSVTLLLSSGRTLHLVLGLLNGSTLLLRNLQKTIN